MCHPNPQPFLHTDTKKKKSTSNIKTYHVWESNPVLPMKVSLSNHLSNNCCRTMYPGMLTVAANTTGEATAHKGIFKRFHGKNNNENVTTAAT